MNRLRLLVLVCLCVLIPGVARADNGGWLDWLYSLDAKMWGIGTEFHICLDDSNKVVNCEEWFRIPKTFFKVDITSVPPATIRHEVDFRVAYYHNYDEPFRDDIPSDNEYKGSINAFRLMALYHYHVTPEVAIGFGAGFMPFFGKAPDGTSFGSFSRGIITPISVIVAPFLNGPQKGFFVRLESIYTTTGFTNADFGVRTPFTSNGGEWSLSVATGYDFRRLR